MTITDEQLRYEGFNAVTQKTDDNGFKYFLTKGNIRLKGLHIVTEAGYTAPVSPSLIFQKIKHVTQTHGLDPIFSSKLIDFQYFRIEVISQNAETNYLHLDVNAVTANEDVNKLYEITLTDLIAIIVEYYHPKELEILIEAYVQSKTRNV
jgi:hypothetical protein